jgi:hypothetical protein
MARLEDEPLYFTFSRGAWAVLIVGFAVAVALDPRRLRLLWVTLVVSGPSIVCVVSWSRCRPGSWCSVSTGERRA